MKKNHTSISLISFLKSTQFKVAFFIFFICSLCFLGSSFVVLKHITEDHIQYQLIHSNNTNIVTTPPKNTLIELSSKIENLIDENFILQANFLDHDLNTQISHSTYRTITPLETIINKISFSTPIYINVSHFNEDIWIEVYPRSFNYLNYYRFIAYAFLLGLSCSIVFLYVYSRAKGKYLKSQLSPILENMRSTKQSNQWKKTPLSQLKELQIFSLAFNALIEKFESINQNLNEQNYLLHHQAYHDTLTRIPNRHYFQEYINKQLKQQLNQYLVLLYIDNNKFKAINDIYGHQAGDAVLIETAKRLKNNLPENAFVARLGGDEFAVVLNRVESKAELEQICEKLIHSSYESLIFNDQYIPFSFSVGASYAYDAKNLEQLLHQADEAMYLAKKSDRKWAIFNPQYFEDHLFLDPK
ncbi:hypothetical protein A3K93_02215 [Acinetobacter sp. NCu2D-2]|nr:hypothetical protein A3K93_02215 [Acinetobacter sp. NCu2D-2]